MKSIVIFYSYEGSTKFIAQTIANEINADLLEIKPQKEMKTHGFMKFVWGGRQAVMQSKPDLLPLDKDLTEYELIIIGTPVWAYNMTPPIRSFLTQNKLSNKKIALFCCHEGNPGKALENIERELQGNEIIGKNDFMLVAKQKDENAKKAKEWAKNFFV